MAYTTINKSTDYFNTKLYTGNGSSQSITGIGHQPDFTWIKSRSSTAFHLLTDAVRGVTKQLYSNSTTAENTNSYHITSFNSDGFSVGSAGDVNGNGTNFVSWNWKANGSGSSNTDGSITSTVSANTTAGFSIVKYTGTGSNLTAGHGLGSVVKMFFVKELDNSNSWEVFHASEGASKNAQLNTTAVFESQGSNRWNSTAPTSTTISIGTDSGVNRSSSNYIAYCFAEKKGYSKFGSYTGNGNADGTFIYTGFKPAFVMFKRSDGGSENWALLDSTRSYANVSNHTLAANSSNAESSFGGGESVFGASNKVDILSNGIKIREASNYNNTSGATYIYMAFGQSLVGSNNVPCTAR